MRSFRGVILWCEALQRISVVEKYDIPLLPWHLILYVFCLLFMKKQKKYLNVSFFFSFFITLTHNRRLRLILYILFAYTAVTYIFQSVFIPLEYCVRNRYHVNLCDWEMDWKKLYLFTSSLTKKKKTPKKYREKRRTFLLREALFSCSIDIHWNMLRMYSYSVKVASILLLLTI